MISLSKLAKPKILIENADAWTQEYLYYIKSNIEPSSTVSHRYNCKEIKKTLEKETYGKCAYCESKIKHIEYGDIDHILPKSVCPELYVEWNNLTFACEICNRSKKRDYYNPGLPLVNPYKDDPNKFFIFLGPMISAQNNNKRAYITEKILDLNRAELIEKRMERLESINNLFHQWVDTETPALKMVLEDELKKEYDVDKEYSAFVKAFLISKGFPINSL